MEKIKNWYYNLQLSTKMVVYIFSISLIIIAFTLGFLIVSSKNLAFNDTVRFLNTLVREYANQTKSDINEDIVAARTLAQAFQEYKSLPETERVEIIKGITKQVITNNPNFLSVYSHWELGVLDSSWTKPYGRVRLSYYKADGNIIFRTDTLNQTGDEPESSYYLIKTKHCEFIEDPYWFSYTNKKEDEILETTVCVPIMDNGKFLGSVGIDLTIDRFNKIVDSISPFENTNSFLLTNSGIYVTSPYKDKSLTGKSFESEKEELCKKFNIIERISKGETFSFMSKEKGINYYYSFAAIPIGKTGTPWSLAIVVPVNTVLSEARSYLMKSIFIGLAGLIILGVFVYVVTRGVVLPIKKTTRILIEMSTSGIIDESRKVFIKSRDEIGKMARALNKLMDVLLRTANFAKQIGEGNLKTEFEPLSNNDILGNSLIEMQISLQKAREEDEKRKTDDEKRNWATEGIALFGELLRKNNNDIHTLSFNIIRNLVEYTHSNQGGFFIINDNDTEHFLELTACFAYDRQKFVQKKIYIGEGLVGSCFQEKESIYLTNIPANYINITSGLGEAEPKALLIVPLKLNEEIFGVIEIASFNAYEKHEIDFIEKVAESIASTISNVKINHKTALLLQQSQTQAELMKSQEEEMRQNMEELTVTQEESTRKAQKMEQLLKEMKEQTLVMLEQEDELKRQALENEGVMKALNRANMTIEYDISGHILAINDNFLAFVNKTREEVIGTHHLDNINFEVDQDIKYEDFWNDLINGKGHKLKSKVEINGNTYWLMETYSPIIDNNGKTIKILKIAIDVTDNETKEEIIKNQIAELKSREEEMKQNIEELQTVQEQMKSKEYLIKHLAEEIHIDEEKLKSILDKI